MRLSLRLRLRVRLRRVHKADIYRTITKYTFSGNGGTNLHKNGTRDIFFGWLT